MCVCVVWGWEVGTRAAARAGAPWLPVSASSLSPTTHPLLPPFLSNSTIEKVRQKEGGKSKRSADEDTKEQKKQREGLRGAIVRTKLSLPRFSLRIRASCCFASHSSAYSTCFYLMSPSHAVSMNDGEQGRIHVIDSTCTTLLPRIYHPFKKHFISRKVSLYKSVGR